MMHSHLNVRIVNVNKEPGYCIWYNNSATQWMDRSLDPCPRRFSNLLSLVLRMSQSALPWKSKKKWQNNTKTDFWERDWGGDGTVRRSFPKAGFGLQASSSTTRELLALVLPLWPQCIEFSVWIQKHTYYYAQISINANNTNILNCKWAVTWWLWLLCMYMCPYN